MRRAVPVLLLLALAGRLYEKRAQARFKKRCAPPGRLIDIGGRRIHLLARGERRPGRPLIVLEAGHGAWSSCWQKIIDPLAALTRVVAVDRAGYGWSDPDSREPTPGRMVTDLHEALARAGEPGPYLLVGHSMGAALARLFASRYPREVLAMVWVDSAHEEFARWLPFGRAFLASVTAASWLGGRLASLGLLRVSGLARMLAQYPSGPGSEDQQVLMEQVATARYMDTVAAETIVLGSPTGWQGTQPSFGCLPVTHLEAQYPGPPRFWLPAPIWARFRRGWRAMHDDLALRSEVIRRVPVQCAHVVMDEQPEAVVSAVEDMWEQVTQQKLRTS